MESIREHGVLNPAIVWQEGECIIFHKHRASQPYHKHGRARSLGQAVRSIIGHESNVPRHPEEGGCGTLCVCGLFVCEAEVS